MAQFCVPFLVVNYGSEMIFILEQRLAAQSVRGEKSAKVLQDVSNALFSNSFVAELVRPQLLYSHATTREIFDRLAHSSIMRLSENSMDKLYDLMTMGCKYQLVACRVPRDLVRATAMHLDAVRTSVKAPEDGNTSVDATAAAIRELSTLLSDGQLADVRHSLLNFFHGKRVRISLLMQEQLQNKDGTFVLPRGPVPPQDQTCLTIPVGTIQYYDATGVSVARTETIAKHPDLGIEQRPVTETRLGRNLYTVDRKKTAPSAAAPTTAVGGPVAAPPAGSPLGSTSKNSSIAIASNSSFLGASPSRPTSNVPRVAPAGKGAFAPAAASNSAAAVSTLANFIVQHAPKETIKIQNLFDEAAPGAGGSSSSGGADTIHIGQMTREAVQRANAELMGVMSGFNHQTAAAAKPAAGDDDLLDLLDNA
jgi:hypothetical protein